MEQQAAETSSFFIAYLAQGLGSCVILLLALYNLVVLIGVMRAGDEDGNASGMAKGAWAVGCLAVVFYPCAPFFGLVAMVLSRIEVGRVWRDESTLASAAPARMGGVNGGVALLVFFLVFAMTALNFVL